MLQLLGCDRSTHIVRFPPDARRPPRTPHSIAPSPAFVVEAIDVEHCKDEERVSLRVFLVVIECSLACVPFDRSPSCSPARPPAAVVYRRVNLMAKTLTVASMWCEVLRGQRMFVLVSVIILLVFKCLLARVATMFT